MIELVAGARIPALQGRAIGSALTWLDIAAMALLLIWQTLGTWIIAH